MRWFVALAFVLLAISSVQAKGGGAGSIGYERTTSTFWSSDANIFIVVVITIMVLFALCVFLGSLCWDTGKTTVNRKSTSIYIDDKDP